MVFQSIFTDEGKANLWSVCYPEHDLDDKKRDIFSMLFDLWNNTEYLKSFFNDNKDLDTSFWEHMSPDEALEQVLDEASHFENELSCIENNEPGYGDITLQDIFKPLHENIYSINFANEHHRKGKSNFDKPIIRLYALELSDATLVVTGGTLKLTEKMKGKQFEDEFKNLKRVQQYLEKEGIDSKEGLFFQ